MASEKPPGLSHFLKILAENLCPVVSIVNTLAFVNYYACSLVVAYWYTPQTIMATNRCGLKKSTKLVADHHFFSHRENIAAGFPFENCSELQSNALL